jgi:uncharacterized protein (TIGR04222 family)
MAADTWGISGPTFLVLYALLAGLVGVWWLGSRRQARAAGTAKRAPGDLTGRPQDLAHLNGGASLAVFATLSAMRLRGWVALSGGTVRAADHPGPGATELERAIHGVTGRPLRRVALPAQPAVRAALDASAERLVRAGLLLSEDARRRLRQGAWAMVAVAVLGLLRLVAGIGGGRPVGLLLVELVAVVVAAGLMRGTVPRRTRLGDQVLAELRSRQHELDPANKPDWTVYGPAAAALGIGLHGVGALWASDPALATELEAQRTAAASGSSGPVGVGDGGGSDGGGGCGGGCGG